MWAMVCFLMVSNITDYYNSYAFSLPGQYNGLFEKQKRQIPQGYVCAKAGKRSISDMQLYRSG